MGSVLFRFVTGIGNSLYLTAGFAILTSEYKENSEKVLGWANAAQGIGLIIGPILGTLFFTYLSYFWCFFIFGTALAILLVFSVIFLPADLNKK